MFRKNLFRKNFRICFGHLSLRTGIAPLFCGPEDFFEQFLEEHLINQSFIFLSFDLKFFVLTKEFVCFNRLRLKKQNQNEPFKTILVVDTLEEGVVLATVHFQEGMGDMEMEAMEDLEVQAMAVHTGQVEVPMEDEGEDMGVGPTVEVMGVDMEVVVMVVAMVEVLV